MLQAAVFGNSPWIYPGFCISLSKSVQTLDTLPKFVVARKVPREAPEVADVDQLNV